MLKIAGRILNFIVWSGIVVLVLLIFVLPLITSLLIQFDDYQSAEFWDWYLDTLQQSQIIAIRAFFWVWIFFVGSCFASFLNVVAWRVPRGKNILGSSHCPQCNIKLNLRNNLPILGWMRNGGRCENCELSIPVRYLIAELVLGSTFLILFSAQTVTGGMTIPFRIPNEFVGIENVLLRPHADLLIMLVFCLVLLSLIFTLAIAATEKFAAPVSIVVFGIVAAMGLQCVASAPGIVDFRFAFQANETIANQFIYLTSDPLNFLIAVGLGVLAAVACFLAIRKSSSNTPHGAFGCLIMIGACLGWQSVLSITILFFLLSAFRPFNACGKLFVATLVHLCLWRLQSHCTWWPGPASGLQQLLLGATYIGILALIVRATNPKPEDSGNESFGDLPSPAENLE
jgi:prepilin signal peptidase PulO-like enzyme (type II secretory pathway)